MDRKQAGILVSLLVLIVIVGVASWKLNGDLPNLNTPVGGLGFQESEDVTDELIRLQLDRDSKADLNMQVLKDIIDNENTSAEERSSVQTTLAAVLDNLLKAQELERQLKAEGYSETYCLVAEDSNNVKVQVKLEDELSEDQISHIRAIVVSQTDIREVEISSN